LNNQFQNTASTDFKNKIRLRFDALAGDRDKWLRRNRYYYEDQHKYFKFLIPEGSSVLELGCGTGELLSAVAPRRGLGIDLSPAIIAAAQKKFPGLDFREGDLECLDNLDEQFDFIVLSDVIGLLQDIEATFRGLHRFCRSDSRIIISYYNFLWEPLLKLGEKIGLKMPQQHQNWLSMDDIDNLLYLADFQVVKKESRLLFPKRVPILTVLINNYVASIPGLQRLCLSRYLVARPLKRSEERSFSTSIIIPCRNEKGNIEAAVKRLPQLGSRQEIIFVDGHSTDGTQEKIKSVIAANPEKDIKFLVQNGVGKGDAVRMGFCEATGDILMILDADLTVAPEDLVKFYGALASAKGEFINGCRLVYSMEEQAMRLLNMLGNKFFSLAFTRILNQRIKDTLCGTKVLLKSNYEKIAANRKYFGEFDPFGDFDLLFGASKLNLKIVEIPIRYRARTYGETQISRFRHGWLLLKMTVFAFFKFKVM